MVDYKEFSYTTSLVNGRSNVSQQWGRIQAADKIEAVKKVLERQNHNPHEFYCVLVYDGSVKAHEDPNPVRYLSSKAASCLATLKYRDSIKHVEGFEGLLEDITIDANPLIQLFKNGEWISVEELLRFKERDNPEYKKWLPLENRVQTINGIQI